MCSINIEIMSHRRELSSPFELVDAGNKQEAETCKHFTIRGYVTGVRKKDANICWPLFTSHDKSTEESNLLLPLHVAKFRRWDCENCLHKSNVIGTVVENGAMLDSHDEEGECIHTYLHTRARTSEKIFLNDVLHLSEEKTLRELTEADSSVIMNKNEHPSSIHSAKKDSEITDEEREGFQVPNTNNPGCEEAENQSTDKPTSVAIEILACQMKKAEERVVVQTTNSVETGHCKDAKDNFPDKSKETETVHEISDLETEPDHTFINDNATESSRNQHGDLTEPRYIINSNGLDQNQRVVSDSDMGITKDAVGFQVFTSDGKQKNKKDKKVRFLADIIKSDELGMLSKKVNSPNRDAEAIEASNAINRRPDASKGNDQHLKSHLAVQKTKVDPIKSKKRYKSLENEDKEPLLKEVNKKPTTHSDVAEIKFDAKSAENEYGGRAVDHTHNDSGNRGKCGNHTKTSNSDLLCRDITGKSVLQDLKIQDRSYEKDIMNKKKRRALIAEEKKSSQMLLSKDSFGKLKQQEKKVIKRPRTTRTCRNRDLEGIPMDIIEFLAKIRHEKRLLDSEATNDAIQSLFEKAQNAANIMDSTVGTRDMVQNAAPEVIHNEKYVSNSKLNSLVTKKKVDRKPKAVHCCNASENHRMDMNQQGPIGTSRGFLESPEYRDPSMSSKWPPKSDSNNNSAAQSRDRQRMQTAESSHSNRAISRQNLFKNDHCFSQVQSTDTAFKVYSTNVDANSHFMNALQHKSMPHMNTDVCDTANTRNQDCTIRLNGRVQAESSSRKSAFISVNLTDNVKKLNHCGSALQNNKQGESSISNRGLSAVTCANQNRNVPATHVLGQRNAARETGSFINNSLDTEVTSFIQQSDFFSDNQIYKLGYELVRPLPRIKALGPFLQKDLAIYSKNFGNQLGYRMEHSNGFKSLETNRKRVSSSSPIDFHAGVGENHKPLSFAEDSFTSPELPSERDAEIHKNQRESVTVQPLKSLCGMEICTVNRNPADFTILDEDNKYMASIQDSSPRHITPSENINSQNLDEGRKRRKVIELIAPAGVVRS